MWNIKSLTDTGSLSILAASFRANVSLILSTSLGKNVGNFSAVTLNGLFIVHSTFRIGPETAVTVESIVEDDVALCYSVHLRFVLGREDMTRGK